jgi:predicted secreted hydrolase
MKRPVWLLVVLATILVAGWWIYARNAHEPEMAARVIGGDAASTEPPAEGFARASGPVPLTFPEAHGPHPEYQTEWWYYTGNLDAADGRHFGYQLTFFRRALTPMDKQPARDSEWATNQVYFAHFALTDVGGGDYQAWERFARGTAGVAGGRADPYEVWLQDWRIELVEDDVYHLYASQDGIVLDLTLTDMKGPILQGDQGYSQKGAEAGNASYYYSLTRLESRGTMTIGNNAFEVEGLSWMDHEFSTSALTTNQVGWDWFALQFSDGSELMMFQIRQEDGSIDPFSSGTFIAPDGTTHTLSREDFEIEVSDTWRSPRSGAEYPAKWSIRVRDFDLTLEIVPYLADQELDVSFAYWEGAVRIEGMRADVALMGAGYIEMTGYAGSMAGQF